MRSLLEIANSPWDQVQTCERLADGVWWVTTASHGGLMVDVSTATEELSAPARQHGMKWARGSTTPLPLPETITQHTKRGYHEQKR